MTPFSSLCVDFFGNSMVTSGLTFISGFITAVIAEPFQKWISRPQLTLSFDHEKVGCGYGAISLTPEANPLEGEKSYYFRVQVTNSSRFTAKNCRPYLVRIERKYEDGSRLLLHSDHMALNWAFSIPEPRDIPPGIPYNFDVFRICTNEDRLHPMTHEQATIWTNTLSEQGNYIFTVQVASDNTKVETQTVEVFWPGSFTEYQKQLNVRLRSNSKPVPSLPPTET